MIHKAFAPALLALALSACAVGPDYQAPVTEPARLVSADTAGINRTRFESAWWRQFDDPTLSQLVQQALEGNRDLRVAFARFNAARALRDDAANDQLPTVTALAGGEFGKAQQPPTSDERVRQERYDLGLDMAWELDLFGRIQRQIEASEAQSEAAEAALYQLQVSLIAELVEAYGNLRGAQLRERIARDNLNNQQESRALTEQLRDAGSAANWTCCAPTRAWPPPRPACRSCRPRRRARSTASPPCSASARSSSRRTCRRSRCR